MTKAQILADLKQLIGPGNPVGDSALTVWLNDAYMYMVDEITKANPDYFIKAQTTATGVNQQEYDLPDDYEKMVKVEVQYGGVWRHVRPIQNISDIDNITSPVGYSTAAPRYALYSGRILLFPTPTQAVNNAIKIWYVYTPSELSADNDTPAIPAKYHHLLKLGAYANFLDEDDEHGVSDMRWNRFEKRVEAMVDNLADLQVDEPRSISVVTGYDLYVAADEGVI